MAQKLHELRRTLFEKTGLKKRVPFSGVSSKLKTGNLAIIVMAMVLTFLSNGAFAQSSSAACNERVTLTSNNFNNLSTSGSWTFLTKENLIDADLTNIAYYGYLLGGNAHVEVKDNDAVGTEVYPVGTYAGFVYGDANLGIANWIKVSTYLDGQLQETKSDAALSIAEMTLDRKKAGFVTTKVFNSVRIEYSVVGSGGVGVYYAEILKPCAGPEPECNRSTVLTTPTHPMVIVPERTNITGLTAFGDNLFGLDNVVNNNTDDYATIVMPATLGGTANISVRNILKTYNEGEFAGFEILKGSLAGLSFFENVTIKTYLDGVLQETSTPSILVINAPLFSGSNRDVVGFKTSQPFNEVQISVMQPIGVNFGSTHVFNPVVKKYCAGDSLACNMPTSLQEPSHPVSIEVSRTGLEGLGCIGCSVDMPGNVIDNDPATHANITLTAGAITGGSISVRDGFSTYPAGTFAGFDIKNINFLSGNLANFITVRTYKNGVLVEGTTTAGVQLLSLTSSIVNGDGAKRVGFKTTQEFDEVRLTVAQTAGVNLATTEVYGVVLEKFCAAPELDCNTPTYAKYGTHPVYINSSATGIFGVATTGEINAPENVIDQNDSNFAAIPEVVGVGNIATIAVKDGFGVHTAGEYVAFDVETVDALAATAFDAISVSTYKDGQLVELKTGSVQLVASSSTFITGENRQLIGFVTSQDFDEVRFSITRMANLALGYTRVYGVAFEKMCAGPISCDTTIFLNKPDYAAVINNERTGVSGVACAGSDVANTQAVVSADSTDFATILVAMGAGCGGAISVEDATNVYPTGSYAGFTIQNLNTLLQADLFETINIATFLNDTLQEVATGPNLLDLSFLFNWTGIGGDPINVGFNTSKPFDEVQISVGALASAINITKVYGAFVDTRYARGDGYFCYRTYPDINNGVVSLPISGNVATNDVVNPSTVYGTPVPSANNPATNLPVINSDGSYAFNTDVPGVYSFDVPVCANASSVSCPTELLTITVIDSEPQPRRFVNNDHATTKTGVPVKIDVLENDKCVIGTLSCNLTPPVVTSEPSNGTVTLNPDGTFTYTPAPNFKGKDEFVYKTCDFNDTTQCQIARVYVNVLSTSAPNLVSAGDDLNVSYEGEPVSGNVLTNDFDPEGDALAVNPQTVTIPGKGEFTIAADGTYTFDPIDSFRGQVDIPYVVCDDNANQACAKATIYVVVVDKSSLNANPDINNGFVGRELDGNLSTNDKFQTAGVDKELPNGTTYGTPEPVTGNPAADVPTVQANGEYTFTGTATGVYSYYVPVCLPGQSGTTCAKELLTITLIDTSVFVNDEAPTANTDITKTKVGVPVNVNVLANDGCNNNNGNCTLSNPTVATAPTNGTATINADGTVKYTPTSGFEGVDSFKYTVCDDQTPAKCSDAWVFVTVVPTDAANTVVAADDYIKTRVNENATGNVLTNDTDPEGNAITAVPQVTTVAGKGTLTLLADGTYTFAPATDFDGQVAFPYTVNDNGTPSATNDATLYVVVIKDKSAVNTNPDINAGLVNLELTGNVATNDKFTVGGVPTSFPAGTTYGTPVAVANNPAPADVPVMQANGSYTFTGTVPGQYNYFVPICLDGQSGAACAQELLTITVIDTVANKSNDAPTANTDIASTPVNTVVKIDGLANDKCNNDNGNCTLSAPVVTTNPANGAVTVTTDNKFSYTPANDFVGVDSFEYTVCDNQSTPLCSKAWVYVTVLKSGAPNSVVAADDYNKTLLGVPVSGNVLTNDIDPEGDVIKVDPPVVTTIPGKGTISIAENGDYTFTPVLGFVGQIEFPYTVKDSANPSASASATLHILVTKPTGIDFTPAFIMQNTQYGLQDAGDRDMVLDIYELLGNRNITSPNFKVRILKATGFKLEVPGITLSSTPTAGADFTSNLVGESVHNSNFLFSESALYITIELAPNAVIPAGGYKHIGFTVKRTDMTATNVSQTFTAVIRTKSGGDTNIDNNQASLNLIITQ